MHIEIREQAFDPWQTLAHYQESRDGLHGKFGATASFVGTMRDFNEGDSVQGMTLEHYPAMTERHLQHILTAAHERWPLLDALVVHRVGRLQPHDPIVLVAVWTAHRGAAFEACRFIMEDLKHKAPFWKQESLDDGQQRWVERNTAG
ncbi:MAG: molybdenum cofactor biosynthesis protein MoaE [Gammaproteobacteria bacterium]